LRFSSPAAKHVIVAAPVIDCFLKMPNQKRKFEGMRDADADISNSIQQS
jgi:hypothetical protein